MRGEGGDTAVGGGKRRCRAAALSVSRAEAHSSSAAAALVGASPLPPSSSALCGLPVVPSLPAAPLLRGSLLQSLVCSLLRPRPSAAVAAALASSVAPASASLVPTGHRCCRLSCCLTHVRSAAPFPSHVTALRQFSAAPVLTRAASTLRHCTTRPHAAADQGTTPALLLDLNEARDVPAAAAAAESQQGDADADAAQQRTRPSQRFHRQRARSPPPPPPPPPKDGQRSGEAEDTTARWHRASPAGDGARDSSGHRRTAPAAETRVSSASERRGSASPATSWSARERRRGGTPGRPGGGDNGWASRLSTSAAPEEMEEEGAVRTTWGGSAAAEMRRDRQGGSDVRRTDSGQERAGRPRSTPSAPTPPPPPSSPQQRSPPTSTSAGDVDDAASRRLLMLHLTARRNYESTKGSASVFASIERLCAAALMEDCFLEHLTAAAAAGAAAAAPASVRLAFTSATSTPHSSSSSSPTALGVLDVPPSVVRWLDTAITLPELSVGTMLETLQRVLTEASSDAEPCEEGPSSAAGAPCPSRDASATDAALSAWCDAWDRQQGDGAADAGTIDGNSHLSKRTSAAAPPPQSGAARATWWHGSRVAVAQVLLSHFVGGDTVPNGAVEHLAAQPHHSVSKAAVELMLPLTSLLSTLAMFKVWVSEVTIRAEYRALVGNGSPAAAAAQAAGTDAVPGTYTHLCHTARRFHATPHPSPSGGGSADVEGERDSEAAAASQAVRSSAQQFLQSIAKVDVVLPGGPSAVAGTADAPLAALDAQVTYTATALDTMINVLLRCLLMYIPALPHAVRNRILQYCIAPWLRQHEVLFTRAACWATLLDTSDALAALRALPAASSTAPSPSTPVSDLSIVFLPLERLVQLLRVLAQPSALDRHSPHVQKLLCIPAAASAPTTRQLHHLHWRQVVSVAQGSEARQRLAHTLLSVFLAAVQCEGSPVATLVTDTVTQDMKAGQQRRGGEMLRQCISICHWAFDVDQRAERQRRGRGAAADGDLLPLLSRACSSRGDAAAPLRDGQPVVLAQLAVQSALPYSLSRHVLCCFGSLLLSEWCCAVPQRAPLILAALQSAVAAPAAVVLRSALHTVALQTCGDDGQRHDCTAAAAAALVPSFELRRVAGSAEWRAVAPAVVVCTAHASPAWLTAMWAYVAIELRLLPRRMSEVLQATHAGADPRPGEEAAAGERRDGAPHGIETCYLQLEELSFMCAWLVVMTRRVSTSGVATAAATAVTAATEAASAAPAGADKVRAAFAQCIRAVLSVWTQSGSDAAVAERLLRAFPHSSHSATDASAPPPSTEEVEEAGQASDAASLALLVELAEAARVHVWTHALRGAVEEWAQKTRFIHDQSHGSLAATPPASAPRVAGDTAASAAGVGGGATPQCADAAATTPPPLTSPDLDPALHRWWRILFEEELGLPSARLYLAQVYAELRRLVVARSAPPAASETDDSGGDVAIFSAAEVVVVVRALSSISSRSATSVVAGHYGAAAFSLVSSEGGSTSILAAMRRVALHAAAAASPVTAPATAAVSGGAAVAATAAAAPSSSSLAGTAAAEPESSAVAASLTHVRTVVVEVVDAIMTRIEKSLMASVVAHSAVLPAVTLVEAAWLCLCPLSTLCHAVRHHATPPPPSAAACQDAALLTLPFVPRTMTAAPIAAHLHGSLRQSSSPWLRSLHDTVVTSDHACRIAVCLCCEYIPLSLSSPSQGDASAVADGSGDEEEVEEVRLLRDFVGQLHMSCAESIVHSYRSDAAATVAHEEPPTLEAAAAAAAPHGSGAGVDGADGSALEGEEGEEGSAQSGVPLQEHGRRFGHVTILTCALHQRLSMQERVVRGNTAAPSLGEEELRELRHMYEALIGAVAAYAPHARHGGAAEVLHALGVVTRRMPLALLRPCRAGEDGAALCTTDALVRRFEEEVQRLMPHVDGELLRRVKARVPQLRVVLLVCSAKASVEAALRRVPAASATPPRLQRGEGIGAKPDEAGPRDATATATPLGSPTLSMRRQWPQVPLASLVHRAAAERPLLVRYASYLCAVAVAAPGQSTAMLPAAAAVRDARERFSWEEVGIAFKALTVSAATFHKRHMSEEPQREDVAAGQDVAGGGGGGGGGPATAAQEQPRRSRGDVPHAAGAVGKSASSSTTDRLPVVVGELSAPRGSGAAPLRVHRTAGATSALRAAPAPLRHTWGDLSRRLLQCEDDPALSAPVLWVLALHCGASVGCAETLVFERLLACLVVGSVQPRTTPGATAVAGGPGATRVAALDVDTWTLVLDACGAAVSHDCRRTYWLLLREELEAFLKRTRTAAEGGGGGGVDGARLCGLLETMPSLVVGDAAFWSNVKRCVVAWGDALAHDDASMVAQLQRSFNWAVQCAGQPRLAFRDTWTASDTAADADAVAVWLEQQLAAFEPGTAPVRRSCKPDAHVRGTSL
ncbi:hypothetical protein NESM_000397000 [Novymonas esmeraldas]|uniref:Non-specific serine/threonine protein kinase n=1 Tax=Novymonas esmeraldas TaxID=1808958 RepID=A0AAW0EM82_9TRYP